MVYRRSAARLLTYFVGLAALGLFYSGEALAVCCKTLTSCSCTASLTCTTGQTQVSSCTTSGGALNLKGSRISCTYGTAVGTISADPGDSTAGTPAVWQEASDPNSPVTCSLVDSDNGNTLGAEAPFDLRVEYVLSGGLCIDDPNAGLGQCKFSDPQNPGKKGGGSTSATASQAVCHPDSVTHAGYDLLEYSGFCGAATVKGHLSYSGTDPAPDWVTTFGGNTNSSNSWVLVLGGFETDKKGNVINCSTDFPDVSGYLSAGQVLHYTEKYAAGSGCKGPRLDASDGKRRMCHDHTFYNPDYDPTTDTGTATNGPCPKVTSADKYIGGALATDASVVIAAELYDNQWKPNSTLNLSCSNQGNIPTTALNSDNVAVSGFTGGTIVAYVTGFPGDTSTADSTSVKYDALGNATALAINFHDCDSSKTGLDQVICKHVSSSDTSVNLTISATKTDGLGFVGNATNIKINNPGNCSAILQ
jgi:hypothetical protein